MTDYIRSTVSAPFSVSVPHASNGISGNDELIAHSSLVCVQQECADLTVCTAIAGQLRAGKPVERTVMVGIDAAAFVFAGGLSTGWDKLTALSLTVAGLLNQAGVVYRGGVATYISTSVTVLNAQIKAPQLFVDLYSQRPSEYDLLRGELLTDLSGVIDFDNAGYIPSGIIEWGNVKLTDRACTPVTSRVASRVYQPPAKEQTLTAPWGPGNGQAYTVELPYLTEPPPVDPGDFPQPNQSEVYIIVNSVNAYALPGLEPLAIADVRLDLDQDSYSWKLNADVLNAASVALLKPDSGGRREMALEINGRRWVFFIDSWGRSRAVNGESLNRRFSISGYSRAQYLGQPFAPKRTRSIGTTTAVQAATAELSGTGFALDWDTLLLPDWAMPNASYSYQELTPLQAIKRLAAAAGAVVQPGMAADTIAVRPRYSVLPWDLLAADMDRTIHESQILSEGGGLETRPQINAVFVSGEREGVALNATRQGTAGDRPGVDVVDAWLTDLPANMSRAQQEIAASGDRIIHTLELAIPETGAQPGLLLPGMTVAVIHTDAVLNYRAYVRGVSISVPGRGQAKVRQTVTLEQPVGWEEMA